MAAYVNPLLQRVVPRVASHAIARPTCGIRAATLLCAPKVPTLQAFSQSRCCSTEAVDSSSEDGVKLTEVPDLDDPERPNENRLARMQMWHAALWWHWENEGRMLWDRMDKVTDDKLFLLTAHTFAKNGTKPADELFEKLEAKFLPLIPQMSPRELAVVGRSFAQHKGGKGSDALWSAISTRAHDNAAGSFSRGQAAELTLAAERARHPLTQKLQIQ